MAFIIFSGLFNVTFNVEKIGTLFDGYVNWTWKILFHFPGGYCWASCPEHTKILVRFWPSLSLFGKYCSRTETPPFLLFFHRTNAYYSFSFCFKD